MDKLGSKKFIILIFYNNNRTIIQTMSYGQQKRTYKPITQFNRSEQIPQLVSYYENAHLNTNPKYNRNALLQQARNQNQQNLHHQNPNYHKQTYDQTQTNRFDNSYISKNTGINQQNRINLQGEQGAFSVVNQTSNDKRQNQSMRSIINELTKELNKLKEVNEGLMIRIKEVQSSYRNLRSELQRINEEDKRKLKINIYYQIQQYIKMSISALTISLKYEKMSPALEEKLQRFMAQMMEINAISVQQVIKKPNKQLLLLETSRNIKKSRIEKISENVQDMSMSKNTLPNKQQYASIMQRLSGDGRMSKSYAGGGIYSMHKENNQLRNVYATTPQKRRKIFE